MILLDDGFCCHCACDGRLQFSFTLEDIHIFPSFCKISIPMNTCPQPCIIAENDVMSLKQIFPEQTKIFISYHCFNDSSTKWLWVTCRWNESRLHLLTWPNSIWDYAHIGWNLKLKFWILFCNNENYFPFWLHTTKTL